MRLRMRPQLPPECRRQRRSRARVMETNVAVGNEFVDTFRQMEARPEIDGTNNHGLLVESARERERERER